MYITCDQDTYVDWRHVGRLIDTSEWVGHYPTHLRVIFFFLFFFNVINLVMPDDDADCRS